MGQYWRWPHRVVGLVSLLTLGLVVLGLYALRTAPILVFEARIENAEIAYPPVVQIEDIPLPPTFFLRLPEFFLAVEERQWWALQQRVYTVLANKAAVQILVRDHEHTTTLVQAVVGRLSWMEVLKRTGLIYLVAVLYVVSTYLVVTRHRSPPGRILACFFLACTLYFLCAAPVVQRSITLPPVAFKVLVTVLYIAAGGLITLAHYALVFPTPKVVVQCHPWCLALLYGYYGLTVLGYLTGLTAFGTTFPFFCFWIGVIVWAFLHALVTEPDPFLKKQINLSLTAPVFAGLFAVFYLLPGVLGLPPVPLTYFALLSLIIPYALPLAMDTRRLYTERLALEQRQRQQERQAQAAKERLERDLHDLVLNNLVVIAHALEALLRHRDQESERLLARLQSIESLVRETSRQMRDLLEVINERYHSWEAFCAYLRQWSYRVVEHAALEFAFESAPALATLPAPTPLLRAGLYCIYREAVLNALRHAQATRIQGSLRVCAQALICEVHDNGVGFEPRQVPIGHQGLTNMRKRASELGGVLTLETAPGHGTRLFCRLPVGGTTASAG